MSRRLITARTLGLVAGALVVAACGGRQSEDRAAVEYKGTDPSAPAASAAPAAPAAPSGATGAGGIVSYEGYQAAVARDGDTVASVANRLGLSPSELGAYNGLPADHRLRAGDELVLPPRPDGYGAATAQASGAPTDGSGLQIAEASPGAAGTGSIYSGSIESGPIESAPTGETAPASASGWSPAVAAAAIDRAQGFDEAGEPGAPPSADEPLPPDPQPPEELASPQLGQYQTQSAEAAPEPPAPRPVETITTPAEQPLEEAEEPAPQPAEEPAEQTQVARAAPAAELSLLRPTRGPIVVGFGQGSGRARNDGVDFAAPVGAPVIAAADGEVALVSPSLGGLGTIVLVRHHDDYLTVYGRVSQVQVVKGEIVSQGQQIGVVASNPQPRLHFEVRKGAESLNPERFFRGST